MSEDSFLGFIAMCIGVTLFFAILLYTVFFLDIEIPRMRNQTVQQQNYNTCIKGLSDEYASSSPNITQCDSILGVKP